MKRRFLCMLAAAGVLLATFEAQAEWPNLNPFSQNKSVTKPASSGSSSWMPSLPSWSKPAAPRSGPTTWQKVQAAPGKMMSSTKQTLAPLNPFKSEPNRKPFTGSSKKQANKDSWWPSWMQSEEPKGPPTTVSDWLDAPRPE